MRDAIKDLAPTIIALSDDNELEEWARLIQEERAKRQSRDNAIRRLDRVKNYMATYNLHFVNGDTGEIIDNLEIW